MAIHLIDLSSNNPPPYDLHAAAASGIDGVVVKLTESTNYLNPYFQQPWADAKSAGLCRAAYHFARPNANSAQADAAWFVAHVPPLAPGDSLVLDLEDGIGRLDAWALAWCAVVHQETGVRPWIYSYLYFIQEHLSDPALAAYPLWLADYGASIPASVPPWPDVAIWQYTETGACPGITGHVDLSRTSMTRADLVALGKASPKPATLIWHVKSTAALKPEPVPSHSTKSIMTCFGGSVVTLTGKTQNGWTEVVAENPDGVKKTGWLVSANLYSTNG